MAEWLWSLIVWQSIGNKWWWYVSVMQRRMLPSISYMISVCMCYVRLNETESLINSQMHVPSCIPARSSLPLVCQCGDDSASACLKENSVYDRSQPTVTYLTRLSGTCPSPETSRYVRPSTIISTSRNKLKGNVHQVIILHEDDIC